MPNRTLDVVNDTNQTFYVKDCAMLTLATGKKARILQEFRYELSIISTASIYHHFWGGLLQTNFDERDDNNDFAAWIRYCVHDVILAERLAGLSPGTYPGLESLRREIIELINVRFEEAEDLIWARANKPFEFLSSQLVVFNTELQLRQPKDLLTAIEQMSTSSIFYHFIDARRRASNSQDDFSNWLLSFGNEFNDLQNDLSGIDTYFRSLSELRNQLILIIQAYFGESS